MELESNLTLLRQAKGDPEALALVTHDLLLESTSVLLRDRILAAAIPHWFTPSILSSILGADEQSVQESFGEITALPFIEPNEKYRAFNLQKALRQGLRRRLREQEPGRFREFSRRAAKAFGTGDTAERIESAYHALWWDGEVAGPIIRQLQRDLRGSDESLLEFSLRFRECVTETSPTTPWIITWGNWAVAKAQRDYLTLDERLGLARQCLESAEQTESEYAKASAAELLADTLLERGSNGDREKASDFYDEANDAYLNCKGTSIPTELLQLHLLEVREKSTAIKTLSVDGSRFEASDKLQSTPKHSSTSKTAPIDGSTHRLRVFVSAVTTEFRAARSELVEALSGPDMWVDTQESFLPFGDRVLLELDDYIQASDAVVHIVGSQTGTVASKPNLSAIFGRYPDLARRLGVDFEFLQSLSYTQWEAWLAVLHRIRTKLYIACPATDLVPDNADDFAEAAAGQQCNQATHLAKLREAGYYPSNKLMFTSPDKLIIAMQRVLRAMIYSDELRDAVAKMNRRFSYVSTFDLINGNPIERSEVAEIMESIHSDDCSGVLLVAAAGFGKSCILDQVLMALEKEMPVAAFKLDSVAECTTADRLGRELDLSGSPVAVLSHFAEGKRCVLMIDQLDAISTVSGRKTGTWEALAEILAEARIVSGMKLILACRDFDLNQDHRLRQLSSDGLRFKKLVVSKFTDQTVAACLEKAGVGEFKPTPSQLHILSLPFHLLLFLEGNPNHTFARASDLFDAYWDRKLVQTREILRHEPKWNEVIDVLTNYMSENQCLSAPVIKVDAFANDASVMASAHVLVREELSYRFFHESFFDYAYARRFCSRGQSLLAFLSTDNQHLFRRAQVRQILTFRRVNDAHEYLRDLREIVASDQVRFHIKRMVASELHRITDPTREEWEIVQPYLFGTDLSNYIWGAFRNNAAWFDFLDELGMWKTWLALEERVNHALWFLQDTELQKLRSIRIAELIEPYVDIGEKWNDRLKQFFSWGSAHLSDRMTGVFFQLIRRGVYDVEEEHRGDRGMWGSLYEASEKKPTVVIDALRVWFAYAVEKYDDGASWNFLDKGPLNKSYQGCQLVGKAAAAEPACFLGAMLSFFVETCVKTQVRKMDRMLNRAWPWLSNNDDPFDINDAILVHLRRTLERLAIDDPSEFRRRVEPLKPYQHESLAYLLLSGFAANPEVFADECIRYMINDKTRLNIGYGSWSGGGNGESALSRTAIAEASRFCEEASLRDLEDAVIEYADEYERTTLGQRGYGELLVLKSIDANRRSRRANVRIHELEPNFPGTDTGIPPVRELSIARAVGSPIAADRLSRLNDKEWVSAMQTYDGSTDRFKGGPHELSHELREFTRKDRRRFAALALKMPNEIRPEYFDAILDGITSKYLNICADEKTQDDKEIAELDTGLLLKLIYRMHGLPGRPCGTSIVHCIGRVSKRELPDEVIDVVSYYAMSDPDPDEDVWQRPEGNWYGRDPFNHGIKDRRINNCPNLLE